MSWNVFWRSFIFSWTCHSGYLFLKRCKKLIHHDLKAFRRWQLAKASSKRPYAHNNYYLDTIFYAISWNVFENLNVNFVEIQAQKSVNVSSKTISTHCGLFSRPPFFPYPLHIRPGPRPHSTFPSHKKEAFKYPHQRL